MNTKQLRQSRKTGCRYGAVMLGVLISFSFGSSAMSTNAQDGIERDPKSDSIVKPSNEQAALDRDLHKVMDSAKSGWPMKVPPNYGLPEDYPAKIKTMEDALAHAKTHYLNLTGTALLPDEVMSVTELWPTGNHGYLWGITVLRIDGKTPYPRISNRLWVNANTEHVSAMLPKKAPMETSTSAQPSTATGSLIPMLLHSASESDNLKKRLLSMKFSNPKSIDDRFIAYPSTEKLHFCDLFALGCDVKDFGSDGDFIWVARRSQWQNFYAEEWFNSRNGKSLKFQPVPDKQKVSTTEKTD